MTDKSRKTGAEMIAHHRFALHEDGNTAEIDSAGLAEAIDNALSASPSPPPSAGVDAVVKRAKYLLDRIENDDGIGIGEIDTMLRMAAALTPAPTPVEARCTICNGTNVTDQSFGMGTSPGECPVCSRANQTPVEAGGEPVVWRYRLFRETKKWTYETRKAEVDCRRNKNYEIEALYSAAGAASFPDGWKLVPAEPTEAMMDAADRSHALPERFIADIYRAMVAESPAVVRPLAKPAPAVEALEPEDLWLLDRLKRDNVRDGVRPVIGGNVKSWDRARRLSDLGMIAIEKVAGGGRLHITRKGDAALTAALAPAAQAGTVAQEGRDNG